MSSYILPVISLLLAVSFSKAYAQKEYVLQGKVVDEHTNKGLMFANIQLENKQTKKNLGGITNSEGNYSISNIEVGEYFIYAYYMGYKKIKFSISINVDTVYNIKLQALAIQLAEVIVTATESRGLTSASVIDSTAMRHLQPTSFTDILELLPGGKSKDPDMGSANLISIREASTNSMSSLGVGFIIDGMPMSNEANLQSISGSYNNSDHSFVSKGIDMRTISTDNIENVEIIRGIPSVEYGDLTNGLVIIKRKNTATPFTARFKADQYSKLFSAGKGIKFGKNGDVLNMDVNYLFSKVDPRNTLENYQRATASLRYNGARDFSGILIKWNVSGDYSGSFNRYKSDKDITAVNEEFKSSYDKVGLSGFWNLGFRKNSFVRSIRVNLSANQEFSTIEETRDVSLNKPTAIPITTEQEETNGLYLPYTYMADKLVDGKPLYINASITSKSYVKWGVSEHNFLLGVNYNYSKNFGQGEIYDLSRPLNGIGGYRPRPFNEIPSIQKIAFFVQDKVTVDIANHELIASLGLRGTSSLNLSPEYEMKGKVYLDPRINVEWNFPSVRGWNFDIAAGIGWLSKMPTMSQLYPMETYRDITQLNYYHPNPDLRIINYMTHKWDNTNYNLEPARNRKWEVRFGMSKAGNKFSITYFEEEMKNGFDRISYYRSLGYKKYITDSIDDTHLVGPPNLANIPYLEDYKINSYNQMGNSASSFKRGIEFQFSSKRIEVIKTRISFNGAWFNTKYSTLALQYIEKNMMLNNKQLEYVGLYQWEDGSIYNQLNSNIVLDTYLDKIGMIFSLSLQCAWFKNNKPLWNDGSPTHYVDKWGEVHPFTEADKEDMELQHLVNTYYDAFFDVRTTPFAMDVNLKVTKNIGKYIVLSVFVNRILYLYPDYYNGGQLIRRTTSPYFGMEANFKF